MAQAQLNGLLVNDGGAVCDCRFEYGITLAYGTYTPWQYGLVTGNTFIQVIYGLNYGTTYYYRAIASNIAGVALAAGAFFSTPFRPPEIQTVSAIGIGPRRAELRYYLVNDMGSPCLVYFEYGLSKLYGQISQKVFGIHTGDSGGIVISDIAAGQPIHYRAVAENKYGKGYGSDAVFSTLSDFTPISGLPLEYILLEES